MEVLKIGMPLSFHYKWFNRSLHSFCTVKDWCASGIAQFLHNKINGLNLIYCLLCT